MNVLRKGKQGPWSRRICPKFSPTGGESSGQLAVFFVSLYLILSYFLVSGEGRGGNPHGELFFIFLKVCYMITGEVLRKCCEPWHENRLDCLLKKNKEIKNNGVIPRKVISTLYFFKKNYSCVPDLSPRWEPLPCQLLIKVNSREMRYH